MGEKSFKQMLKRKGLSMESYVTLVMLCKHELRMIKILSLSVNLKGKYLLDFDFDNEHLKHVA